MAVPKKKTSKMRKRMRFATWKVKVPNVSIDKTTGTYVLSHRVNPSSGTYKGKVVLENNA